MANIALRNPQYKFIGIPSSGVLSAKCTITIDGTLRYTLIKNVSPNTGCNFDISELARDYLDITYSNTYGIDFINIVTVLTTHPSLNGIGTAVATVTYTDKGYEAFGYYTENSNPTVPFTSGAQFLIAPQDAHSSLRWQIYVPFGVAGYVGYTNSTGIFSMSSYSATDTTASGQGNICTINRIDCTKYGDGRKITFINRYGVQQDLWFFLKRVKTMNTTNEKYQSNTIEYPNDEYADYNKANAPTKLFNTQAKQIHKLSSGYYPETANDFFKELLLSEYVWMTRPKEQASASEETIPVVVKTSNMTFKTSLNDKLIEYTIEFEEAFDLINNIR
tara:strand:+ start:6182 stop:7180 length:999 start_codon:yes stop_codon:yes gene_type:complete